MLNPSGDLVVWVEVVGGLEAACPDGIDVYFDNTGGEILDACLARMNLFGRVVTCGQISQYTSTGGWSGPSNYGSILVNRLTVRGFIILDHADRYPEAIDAG